MDYGYRIWYNTRRSRFARPPAGAEANAEALNADLRGIIHMARVQYNWDYELPKNWQPTTERQWLWYLERKINYDDWEGLRAEDIKRYLPKLKKRLDPGKQAMLKHYFKTYGRAFE